MSDLRVSFEEQSYIFYAKISKPQVLEHE
jgi:hypothetical protein